jgi:uncharacterized protein (TIGR03118 family)
MKLRRRGRYSFAAAVLVAAAVAAGIASARTTATGANSYVVHNLTSDVPGVADHTDPNLVNAWGLDALPVSPWWVSDNGTNLSTLYNATGTPQSLVVSVPNAPTGLVAYGGSNFIVTDGTHSGPALFMFSTEEGKILGWNPNVSTTVAQVAVNLSRKNAVFKGLAIAPDVGTGRLYATDFHNNVVDVWNGNFHRIVNQGAFVDPNLPAKYGPFGIQTIGDRVFVTYAKHEPTGDDEAHGPGLGFVDEYDTSGTLLQRVASHGVLNAPWGLAMAPSDFGRFSGDLLVGNFGNGWINGFTPQPDGTFTRHGPLKGPGGYPIAIDGLWALEFGKGSSANGPTNTLFFTAGPQEETHGLFGSIVAS